MTLLVAFFKSSSRTPTSWFSMISLGPVTGYPTTGVPEAKDSNVTNPNVSVLLGKTSAVAEA